MAFSSISNLLNRSLVIVPFLLPIIIAIRVKIVTWAVNAFVEATPISGPACVYDPQSVSLEIELPTTLQIPISVAPLSLASFKAAKVSAVSPD